MLTRICRILPAFCALALFIGCSGDKDGDYKPYGNAPKNTDTHGHDHDHHHEGPHGGHVIELTADHSFHGELTFAAEGRKITVYILGGDLETAVPVDLDAVELHLEVADGEAELKLTAAPQAGDPEGKASVFVAEGDAVPASIDDIEKIHGHLHVTIDGKALSGDIVHDHDHDDHDHDHGKDEKKAEGETKANADKQDPESGSTNE